jgi:hypothetical protein
MRAKAMQDFTMTGDINAYNSTLQQLGGKSVAPSTPGVTPTAGAPSAVTIPPAAIATWKNSADAAASAYPNDPTIKQYSQVLANPSSTTQQMAAAANGARNRMSALDTGVESRTKQEAAAADSSVAKLSTPEALAAPGVQAAIQSKIADPTTDPADLPRLRALLPQANLAQFQAETIKNREARNTQAISQGDPSTAGHLLATRSLTIEELKSRQVTFRSRQNGSIVE